MAETAYERLNREAEGQGFRVLLTQTGTGARSRLGRLVVVDEEGAEVGALRVRPDRPLEATAEALLTFLEAKREAEA
jgi:hypothetical protein